MVLGILLDLLFPIRSLRGTEGIWVTEGECRNIELMMRPMLLTKRELWSRGIRHLDALVAAGHYSAHADLRILLQSFKYHRIHAVGATLSKWLLHAIPGLLLSPITHHANAQETDFLHSDLDRSPTLVPVPLHWTRQFWRGFNQAEILARSIAETRGWSLENLLIRTRPTGHQAWRKREQRLTAMRDAFRYVPSTSEPSGIPSSGPPPWVVLVDDICTTGTTLSECAAVLKEAGVQHVSGLVVAYG